MASCQPDSGLEAKTTNLTNHCTSMIEKNSPSVIVIGAGISGLAAARALQNWDCKVIVLESRDRVGGRIYTDYSNGFPVDMGASWLHGVCQENPLARLIGQLGLQLYRTSDDNSILYDHDLRSYALFDMDGNQVPPEVVMQVGETFKALLEEAKEVRKDYCNDMSVSKAFSLVLERRPDLRLVGLPYKVLQWYICRMEGWFAVDTDKISVQFVDEEELLEGGHGLMVNGYSPVLMTLSEDLNICLNQRVARVIHDFCGVQVLTEDGSTFSADAAVVTVPLGVLKSNLIKFEPKLPEWKQAAISGLGTGSENKIALFFDCVCWPNVEFLGVVAPTSYGCSYFLNLHKATGHPVLVYMPAGSLANDIEKMSDKAAATFAMTQLKRILPHAKDPAQYLVSHWGTDVNSLGCYSYDPVGRAHDIYTQMQRPVGNLFFAGEATSVKFPGTVHGAFLTGTVAAEQCYERFLEDYKKFTLFQPEMAEEHHCESPLLISRI